MNWGQRQYHTLTSTDQFIQQLKKWATQFEHACILDNNSGAQYSYPGEASFDLLIGAGCIDTFQDVPNAFDRLSDFHQRKKDWLFGYLSYDLKNQLEDVSSDNRDYIQFPQVHFFQPKYVFKLKGDTLEIGIPQGDSFDQLIEAVKAYKYKEVESDEAFEIHARIKHADYIKAVMGLKHHIQVGDIYEVNFCQEFYAEKVELDPWNTFQKLMGRSATPFATFYKCGHNYLMCASPERYLKKVGEDLISQPIKGTVKRGKDAQEDQRLADQLFNDQKERSENVMIVDLVRNDLSRSAQKGSVHVSELYGIYAFPQVFQMISTVNSKLREDLDFVTALKDTFPMGSMTGAPKVKAMELIEEFESTKRGLYSGAVGYITPCADFDFNVVIRGIQYNAVSKYLNFMVGGAITSKADPESEYQESLLKAKAIFEVLTGAN